MDREWRREDLRIIDDALGWLRANTWRFFDAGSEPSNEILMERLEETLHILQPEAAVHTELFLGRGVLVCDLDWIAGEQRDAFREMVPFPEAGQNACRDEVLITAYCSFAATFNSRDGDIDLLVGRSDRQDTEAIDFARGRLGISGRAVVFRV